MNIVEVQENLKNFSQDQLINEINQPSGMVPQFLVLTELGRRNRIKQDMEGRQAQNQPTVAQEVVSAAGVPQGGIMDMARSMAPKSSIEQNDGVQMMEEGGKPKNRMEMLLAYLRSLGADEEEEVKEATGGRSIAEIINFGGDFRPVEKADGGVVKMQMAGSPTREVVLGGKRYITDGSGRVFEAARRGSMRRGREITDPEIVSAVLATGPSVASDVGGLGDVSTNLDTLNPITSQGIASVKTPDAIFTDGMFVGQNTAAERMPTSNLDSADMSSVLKMTRGVPAMRDPAVIDPTTGLPYNALGSLTQQAEQARQADAQAAFDRSLPTPDELMVPFNNTRDLFDPQGLNQQRAERDRILANEIAARGREDELSTFPVRNVFQDNQPQDSFDAAVGEIAGIGRTNFKTAAAIEAENQNREDSLSTFPIRNVFQDNQPQDPINFSSTRKRRKDRDKNEIKEQADSNVSGRNDPPRLDRNEFGLETEDIPFSEIPGFGDTPRTPIGSGRGRLQDIPTTPTTDPDTDPDPNSAISSLESEIANMLKENEEDREKDKYLALAKMGLALMSSSQPTFGGALGEAGMAGLDDLQASRQSYRDDKIALLDARRKLEQARATAASKDKSGLTGTNIISRLNNIQTRKTGLLQKIAELENPSVPSLNPEKSAQSIETLKREVADLSVKEQYFQSLLGGIGSLSSSGVDLNATAN